MRPLLFMLCTGCALLSPASNNQVDGGASGGGPDAHPMADARPGSSPDAEPPPTSTVSIIVEPNGNSGSELVTAINGAHQYVYMTMYQLDDTHVIDALVARAQANVDVQVILDGSSNSKSWNQSAYDTLSAGGVSVVWSSTAFTYTHEKTVIIDGTAAWIMTMNSNTSSPKDNREYLAIDTTAADIAEARAIFVADHAHQSITPSGGLVVAPVNARPDLVALINSATTSIDVESEEFSDTYSTGIAHALAAQASRGITVHVVIANQTLTASAQSAITEVKNGGATVVETGPTSSNGTASNPYIHAKAIVIDCNGTTSCAQGWVGSENLSAGSLGYNRELGVIFDTPSELAKVATAIHTDYGRGSAL